MVGRWRSAVWWKQERTYCTSFSVTVRRGVLSWSWLSCSPLMQSQRGAGALQRRQPRSAGSGEGLMCSSAGKVTVPACPPRTHRASPITSPTPAFSCNRPSLLGALMSHVLETETFGTSGGRRLVSSPYKHKWWSSMQTWLFS